MDYLFVCNSGSDDVSKINLKDFHEDSRIPMNGIGGRIGPHGICGWKSNIITADNYSNSITIIDVLSEESQSYYIGGYCNDIAIYRNEAFIACGESNDIVVFDLLSEKVEEELPVENLPHSVELNAEGNLMVTTNMLSDSITIIDAVKRETLVNIKVGHCPTKAVFSSDSKYIFVCESNLGSEKGGFINIISTKTFSSIKKIPVGKGPIDIFCDNVICYISNFLEGYITLITVIDFNVVKKVYIGGMPRGIIKKDNFLYVGDNYNGRIFRYNLFNGEKKAIAVGKEPTGMTTI
ncbi:YncE family protein [Clostridium sp. 19966]|uniref:YncE family protein n=1 Tax=Clostridium sp. 19966 TaxID=2768166 RepID=UPI0028DE788B|nr:YncE family protein [Clostridium sp. 19966]MDT8716546.1 YncE family protein [Clostridium sp. 19966]